MRYFETTSNRLVCDLCGIDEELPMGTCMVGCRPCAYDMCAKHLPESYEFHKVEITIAQAVAGIEIAKMVVDVVHSKSPQVRDLHLLLYQALRRLACEVKPGQP